MIAGDLLPKATQEQKIATGLSSQQRWLNSEAGSKDDEIPATQRVRIDGNYAAVWLGSTIGCAQLPRPQVRSFTQKDFYNMYAIFNNTARGSIDLTEMLKVYKGTPPNWSAAKPPLKPLASTRTQTPELDAAQSIVGASTKKGSQRWNRRGNSLAHSRQNRLHLTPN